MNSQMPTEPDSNLCASNTVAPSSSYVFVPLDCLDKRGQPRPSDLAKSRILADVAKKRRARQAETEVSTIRSLIQAINREGNTV
jgi:hypothetical protein